MSFKPGFYFKDDHSKPVFSGQAFATYEEAHKSVRARFNRWTMPTGCCVVESDEPVNYRWDDERGDVLLEGE
jgi:hypothetical protein